METTAPVTAAAPKQSFAWAWILLAIIVLALLFTQITFFAIQPIGALPQGATVVMWRGSAMQLFDSPDAMCLRRLGKVNPLCRVGALSVVSKDTLLFKLPYIEAIYLWSTGGKNFEN